MELFLPRDTLGTNHTFGKLYLGSQYLCETLEDKVRPDGVKIYGETAIPEGRYRVVLSKSNRLKIVTPEILAVPDFKGIRMHSGNKVADTLGCPLVGTERSGETVLRSRLAFRKVMLTLNALPASVWEDMWINVTNPTTPIA